MADNSGRDRRTDGAFLPKRYGIGHIKSIRGTAALEVWQFKELHKDPRNLPLVIGYIPPLPNVPKGHDFARRWPVYRWGDRLIVIRPAGGERRADWHVFEVPKFVRIEKEA